MQYEQCEPGIEPGNPFSSENGFQST